MRAGNLGQSVSPSVKCSLALFNVYPGLSSRGARRLPVYLSPTLSSSNGFGPGGYSVLHLLHPFLRVRSFAARGAIDYAVFLRLRDWLRRFFFFFCLLVGRPPLLGDRQNERIIEEVTRGSEQTGRRSLAASASALQLPHSRNTLQGNDPVLQLFSLRASVPVPDLYAALRNALQLIPEDPLLRCLFRYRRSTDGRSGGHHRTGQSFDPVERP